MRSRTLLFLVAFSVLLGCPAGAADNDLGQPQYIANAQRIQMRTTDSGGVHTPHVIIARSSTIATSHATLSTSASVVLAANSARQTVLIRNTDAALSVYLGASGVTSGTGLELKAGEAITIRSTAAIYAVAASGTPVLHTLAEND